MDNDNAEVPDEHSSEVNAGSEIFADEVGKMVFDAFEKLGSELNTLTENLEAQFEDVKETDSDGPAYENIDIRGIITASMEDRNGAQAEEAQGENEAAGCALDAEADEDLVDLLNNSLGMHT